MSSETCNLSGGWSIFTTWIMPETLVHERCGEYYKENPFTARFVATPFALLSGMMKVFLFPVMCAVGVVAMPIIALVRAFQDKTNNGSWLLAWTFCVLGLAASIAFIGVTAFHVPLVISVAIIIVLISISITCHVHHLVKEPSPSSF